MRGLQMKAVAKVNSNKEAFKELDARGQVEVYGPTFLRDMLHFASQVASAILVYTCRKQFAEAILQH
eukprot:1160515-Pelagomonas_calceolata.AAC.4